MKKIHWNCPVCGSENVELVECDCFDDETAQFKMICLDCDGYWINHYELVLVKTENCD